MTRPVWCDCMGLYGTLGYSTVLYGTLRYSTAPFGLRSTVLRIANIASPASVWRAFTGLSVAGFWFHGSFCARRVHSPCPVAHDRTGRVPEYPYRTELSRLHTSAITDRLTTLSVRHKLASAGTPRPPARPPTHPAPLLLAVAHQ